MARVELEIEAVTATFLHVEPEGPAQWRAAPVRGAMRWWYRAVAGGSERDAVQVREREAALFGRAERASPVQVRVIAERRISTAGFVVNPGGRRGASRQAIAPGARARLVLLPQAEGGAAEVEQAWAALWLAFHLGGIGQRSRRGAGSLRVLSQRCEGVEEMPLPPPDASVSVYKEVLEQGIQKVRKVLGLQAKPQPTLPGWPSLDGKYSRIVVAEQRWGENERMARQELMKLRRDRHRNATGEKENEFGGIGRGERLSSPLWVRVPRLEKKPQPGLVVATLFEHGGARGADWANAHEYLDSLPGPRQPVKH